MQDTHIEDTVRQIIGERLSRDPDEVTLNARLVDDLGADPVEVAELCMALQEEFNILMDDESCRLQTVADVMDYVHSKIYD